MTIRKRPRKSSAVPGYLTHQEACNELGIARVTLWRWRQEGYIKAEVPPGKAGLRIPVGEIKRLKEEWGEQ